MGKTAIIIKREFTHRVRKKSFILTTLLTPVLLVLVMLAPILILKADTSRERVICVIDRSGVVADRLGASGSLKFTPTDKTESELRREMDPDIFGYLVIGENVVDDPGDVRLYSYETSTLEIESEIASRVGAVVEEIRLSRYRIDNLPQILEEVKTKVAVRSYLIDERGEDKASSGIFSYAVAFLFGFLIYLFVFMYGSMVMQGVVEEKSSKVLEIMVSSVKPFQLMIGKIVGISLVALTQFFIWMVLIFGLGALALGALSPDAVREVAELQTAGMDVGQVAANMDPGTVEVIRNIADAGFIARVLGGFLLFFIGGYLLYAALFAAIGSAVDSAADTQQMQLPVTVPLILAMLILIHVIRDPYGGIAFWFSMIPLTSPIIMVARLPFGVPFWQVALSLAILCASFILTVWFAGKVYRVGIFMYGKKPGLKEIIRWACFKG